MKIPILRLMLWAFVASVFSLSASAQTSVGQIKAVKVEGEVLKLTSTGGTVQVTNGELIAESDTLTTGKSSSVVLVFMNGSTVKLGADSRLSIDEFKMDPLAQPINAATLKAEPSISKTSLKLSYGEMVGDVKKLNASSSYSIKTPVGAAGIRGTIYRIVYRPSSDGKAFFTISTAEGLVVMEGVSDADIPIEAGKEVVVEIDTDNPTAPKIVTQDIPADTKTAITTVSQELTQVIQEAIISNPGATGGAQPPPPTPPPPPEPPPPVLTPGAGK